jgi:hypothetical protein
METEGRGDPFRLFWKESLLGQFSGRATELVLPLEIHPEDQPMTPACTIRVGQVGECLGVD